MTRGGGSPPPSLSGAVAALRDAAATRNAAALRAFFQRQEAAAGVDFDADGELAADLFLRLTSTVTEVGELVADHLEGEFNPDRTLAYLAAWASGAAERINAATRAALDRVPPGKAADEPEDAAGVFVLARETRAPALGLDLATRSSGWGVLEAGKQMRATYKTWSVTALSNSRHPQWDGDSVEVYAPFANGAQYPGDPTLGPNETSGCLCTMYVG